MNPDPNQPQTTPPAATGAGLQFDKAEVAGEPLLACAVCKTAIVDEYYQANGQTICPTCRAKVATFGVGGSGAARLGKALAAGLGAGFVGFVGYYLVLKITGYNIGLIAIAVGWLVGAAVRWGSEGRGGRIYQIMAAAIAYIAACATYAPFIVAGVDPPHTIFTYIVAFVLSQFAPWLEGPSNIIGWVILGFAVYQAWILNRAARIEVSGPFFTRQSFPPAAT